MTNLVFRDHREAALALLNGHYRLTISAGRFLGQIAVVSTPLSKKQNDWLSTLLARGALPPLQIGEGS